MKPDLEPEINRDPGRSVRLEIAVTRSGPNLILFFILIAQKATEYLFGLKAVLPYRLAWVVAVVIGSVLPIQRVWDFADVANG